MADPAAPDVSNPDAAAPDAGTVWNTVDLNRPGWGDDSLANRPVQFWGLDGLSPDLGTNLQKALHASILGQDASIVNPGARPFMNLMSSMATPQLDLGPGLLGRVDATGAPPASPVDAAAPEAADQDDDESNDNDQDVDNEPDVNGVQEAANKIRQRDIDYLDRYYDAASRYSKQYKLIQRLCLGWDQSQDSGWLVHTNGPATRLA